METKSEETRWCSECYEDKPIQAFRRTRGGVHVGICRSCSRDKAKRDISLSGYYYDYEYFNSRNRLPRYHGVTGVTAGQGIKTIRIIYPVPPGRENEHQEC